MAETSRDLFASRLGMLAATLGSSVGLGNIWKFPALTGEHGGASFLLVYILSTLVVGLPLMIAELLIGRSTRSNAYQAFKTLSSNRFWWIIGGLGIAGAVTILSFYSDVAGWVFAYIPKALTGSVHTQDPAVAKEAFSSLLACPWKSLFWQWLVLGLTASVILRGASGGIEKATRILIPLSIIAKHPLKDADAPDKPIVFFCHSGNRTANASDLLERLAGDVQAYRLDGGISGWEKAGLPVEHISSTIPLFRQIQIAAGSLVLIGVIGSAFWHPFFWLSAFVGAGLVFAGISGFCGLGVLLSHMPWNRR